MWRNGNCNSGKPAGKMEYVHRSQPLICDLMNIFNFRISGEKLHGKIKIANIGSCFFVAECLFIGAE